MAEKMSRAAMDARNEYNRQWRKKNPDKVRASNERYWNRVAEKLATERDAVEQEEAHGNNET